MAQYYVYFRPSGAFSVRIDLPDEDVPEDGVDLTDLLIDKAYEVVPNDVCAQCGGWGQPWSLDFNDLDVQAVESADGELLLEEK